MRGTMVACLTCKTVVWAYKADYGDLRAICNMFKLPCPKCGTRGNFDGWSLYGTESFLGEIHDRWGALRHIAKTEGLAWEPHPYNEWPCEPAEPSTWHARQKEGASNAHQTTKP